MSTQIDRHAKFMANKPKLTAAEVKKAQLLLKAQEAEQQRALEEAFQMENETQKILDAATSAAMKATSVGEMRRIRRLANEKVKLIQQLARKSDWT